MVKVYSCLLQVLYLINPFTAQAVKAIIGLILVLSHFQHMLG